MFGRKKEDKVQTNAARQNAAPKPRSKGYGQMGLLDVPNLSDLGNLDNDMDGDDFDDDDDELEAELMALQAGLDVRKVISRHRLEAERSSDNKPKNDNEFGSDDDVDENDPELLAELQGIHEEELRPSAKPPQPSVPTRPAPQPRLPVLPPSLPQMQPHPRQGLVSESSHLSATLSSPPPPSSSPSQGSPVDVLLERIEMYKTAQRNAKEAGETMKLRRLDRGLKTLESMLKSVKAGRSISEEDIPPPVALGTKPVSVSEEGSGSQNSLRLETTAISDAVMSMGEESSSFTTRTVPPLPPRTTRPAPVPPPSHPPPSLPVSPPSQPPPSLPVSQPEVKQSLPQNLSLEVQNMLQLLNTRKMQYRQAALASKKENDKERTLEYVKIAKQFDMVISAVESGQEVDLSNMPPPPTSIGQSSVSNNPVSSEQTMPPNVPSNDLDPIQSDEPLDPSVFNAPLPPTSTYEALQQRLQKYHSAVDEANSADNASKARRMGRIVKQYEDAIKAYKAGKPVDFEELPTPPGFAPIPRNGGSANSPQPNSISAVSQPKPVVDNVLSPTSTLVVPNEGGSSAVTPDRPPVPARASKSPTTSGSVKTMQRSPQALHEKQHAALVERQGLFKAAALDAKRRGDIQAAKEYLKLAKGFEPMIKASLCGLPVNMDSVPKLPQQSQESTFELVSHEDCEPIGDREELFEKLDKELIAQIEMCANNRSHFSKIGDIQSKKKFEKLLLDTKKDLDFVRHANKGGFPVPRFHYEMKTFSIVKCYTDLGDDDMELNIIKGINYACPNPKDVDTYVRFEFPYPPEAPQKDKTFTVRDNNNPEYNAVFKLNMSRKARTLTRVIKRQAIKLEVWSKGGFLRSDSLIGTAVVKLAPLETCCTIHDSFDLMEGRKPIGGKLEVQIRIRDPILNKEVETLCEKWLLVTGGHTSQV